MITEQIRRDGHESRYNYKTWPSDCVWPEPFREQDLPSVLTLEEIALSYPLDEETNDLLEIKEYFDGLVAEGVLVEGYKTYEDEERIIGFFPEKGEKYWAEDGDSGDNGYTAYSGHFDIDAWREDISERINLLKLESPTVTPVPIIEAAIAYQFINENLLRQAFTRRAFGLEYKVGDCEQLEFIGDSVLNTVVTREIVKHLAEIDIETPDIPFKTSLIKTSLREAETETTETTATTDTVRELNEGDFTKIRVKFVSKEYLAERAALLGLDKFILYGTCEEASDSAREDVIEALIGAVAIDSNWDWEVLERVVDRLVNVQVSNPFDLLKATFYETLNSWHQKQFGCIPDYKVFQITDFPQNGFTCRIKFNVPESNGEHQIEAKGETRSKARELAAELAYHFIVKNGLWLDLKRDAGIEPNLYDAINQLQELHQHGYVDKPSYSFKELGKEMGSKELGKGLVSAESLWSCDCLCSGVYGYGSDKNKTQAKKRAAFMVLEKLLSPSVQSASSASADKEQNNN